MVRLQEKTIKQWEDSMRPLLSPIVRPLLGGQAPFSFSTRTLCGIIQVLPPADQIHVRRLRFCRRLLDHGPPALWDLMHALESECSSWISLLRSSFRWLAKHTGPRCPLDPDAPLADWWVCIRVDDRWFGRVAAAKKACLAFYHAEAQAAVWERAVLTQLEQDGVSCDLTGGSHSCSPWICEMCDARFATKKALAVHAARFHDYRALVQHFALDGLCPGCADDFHQRSRLCAHLQTAAWILFGLAFPHCLQIPSRSSTWLMLIIAGL